jgi:zinc D-Ala-D-Ala carboxypeptidase
MRNQITPHFTLWEMIRSQTATRFGIYNMPNAVQFLELEALCKYVLEPLRAELRVKFRPDATINVNSGYRAITLNRKIGGSPTSQHPKGQAADIEVSGMTVQDLFIFIIESGLVFDQLIQEFDGWVHISFKRRGKNRRQILYARYDKQGRVYYTKYTPSTPLKMGAPVFYGSRFTT